MSSENGKVRGDHKEHRKCCVSRKPQGVATSSRSYGFHLGTRDSMTLLSVSDDDGAGHPWSLGPCLSMRGDFPTPGAPAVLCAAAASRHSGHVAGSQPRWAEGQGQCLLGSSSNLPESLKTHKIRLGAGGQ